MIPEASPARLCMLLFSPSREVMMVGTRPPRGMQNSHTEFASAAPIKPAINTES